jgi:hypothetical protein
LPTSRSFFSSSFLFTQANNTLLATLGFWMRLVFGPFAWPFFFTKLTCISYAEAEICVLSRILLIVSSGFNVLNALRR